MKNMMVYLSPDHKFTREHDDLVRIQIDNSYRMGWNKENILLITNFKYNYNGIDAIVVDDNCIYPYCPLSNNTIIVPYLCELGLVEDDIYWSHDFDAYQLESLNEINVLLNGNDVGLTTYGWSDRWCMGSFFFKKKAMDVFELVKQTAYNNRSTDEKAVLSLTKTGRINGRYIPLNITYNLGKRHTKFNYSIADKPLKVIHFHPHRENLLQSFMYGKNEIGIPLMTDGLIEVFRDHGVC